MPRIARVVGLNLPHHITQRGNFQQDVFVSDYDREQYLAWLKEYGSKYGLKILAYCLMTNHVHFVAVPENDLALANTFNILHMRYSQYFNKRFQRNGHLWQGRFHSCVLDERHLVAAARYVERNPVRARIVKEPCDWRWSSAKSHVGLGQCTFNSEGELLQILNMSGEMWRDYLKLDDDSEFKNNIRKHSLTGRPLSDNEFTKKLEQALNRKLTFALRGRPRKKIGSCP